MKRFIVFRADRLGDFLIIINIIKAIKKKYKKSHITVLCSSLNYKLVKNYKIIDKIFIYNKTNSLFSKLKIFNRINNFKYYASLSLDGKTFSNFINLFLRSKYKFGISYKFYLFELLNIYWSKPNLLYNFLIFDKFLFFTSKKFLKKIEHLPTILYRIVKDLKLNIKVSDPYHYEVDKKQNLKFTRLFKSKIKNKYILIHLDEKWSDIKDINDNFYNNLILFQKKIKKKIVITSFKNNLQYYKNMRNKIIKNKHFLLFENLPLGMFERFISKSLISISCHSGFLVQVSGTNRSNIIDVINKIDYNWYSSWKPYNTQHKFIFKSNLYKKFKIKDILDNIITISKKFK